MKEILTKRITLLLISHSQGRKILYRQVRVKDLLMPSRKAAFHNYKGVGGFTCIEDKNIQKHLEKTQSKICQRSQMDVKT